MRFTKNENDKLLNDMHPLEIYEFGCGDGDFKIVATINIYDYVNNINKKESYKFVFMENVNDMRDWNMLAIYSYSLKIRDGNFAECESPYVYKIATRIADWRKKNALYDDGDIIVVKSSISVKSISKKFNEGEISADFE